MHILYIHQYFATPFSCMGTRSYEFARRWVAKGHKVTMLTTTPALTDSDLKNATGRFFKRFTIDGIDVLAIAVPYKQEMGIFKRCLSFFAFLLLASVVVLFIRKVDIVYATSTPLTVGIPAVVAKWFRWKKFVFEVRDQWPASVIEMGLLKNKFLIKTLSWLERFIYKNSAAIIALSDGMAEGIRQVAEEGKPIHVIPNGADLDLFRPDINGDAIRREKNWGDKLVLMRAGVMGKISGLEFIVDVIEKLRNHQDILFVLIGYGSKKTALERRVKELSLANVEFLPAVPKLQLPAILAAADVIIPVTGEFEIMERHASHNKFFDGLSCGKPILLNYSGWQRKVLEENNAGYGCKQYDVDEFIEKVLYLNSHRDRLSEIGQNARQVATEKFDRDNLAMQALDVISSIAR